MSCSSRSVKGWIGMPRISGTSAVIEVTRFGTWQRLQPMAAKSAMPAMAFGSS